MRSRLTRLRAHGASAWQALFVVCALTLLPLSAVAHHGWAGNGDEEFEISGTVSSAVNLVGPHATMKIKASDGQVWDLTLASAPQTKSAGSPRTRFLSAPRSPCTDTGTATRRSSRSRPSG